MELVTIKSTSKTTVESNQQTNLINLIKKIGSRLAHTNNINQAQMLNGSISILIGAYNSGKIKNIQDAMTIYSKATSSW